MGDWAGSSWHLSLCGLFHPQHPQCTATRLLTVLTFCRFHRLGPTLQSAQRKAQSCWLTSASKQTGWKLHGKENQSLIFQKWMGSPWKSSGGTSLPCYHYTCCLCTLSQVVKVNLSSSAKRVLYTISSSKAWLLFLHSQVWNIMGWLNTFANQTIVTMCHTGTGGGENCFKRFLQ